MSELKLTGTPLLMIRCSKYRFYSLSHDRCLNHHQRGAVDRLPGGGYCSCGDFSS
ncbi:hypothetical protein KCP69_15495 [Salmonella enterica subsp. enterica]|nr:hypothetical protein KCP69_15495 [Salmonella enterica subsp. enterica]